MFQRYGEMLGCVIHSFIRAWNAPWETVAISILRLKYSHLRKDEPLPDSRGHAFGIKGFVYSVPEFHFVASPPDCVKVNAQVIVVPVVNTSFRLNWLN